MLSIIAAMAQNRAIGFQNKLIYSLPNDMKRFRQLTTGNTIIMGRKTFESLPGGALPNRRNIVISRTAADHALIRAECYPTLSAAISAAQSGYCHQGIHSKDIYIIGGASVYQQALPLADRLCLTYVYDTPPRADTFFPEINTQQWTEVYREEHPADQKHSRPYAFIDLLRRPGQ